MASTAIDFQPETTPTPAQTQAQGDGIDFTPDPAPTGNRSSDWLDTVSHFAQGLWSKVNPSSAVQGAAQLAAHPLATYTTDAGQRQAILDNAEKDFKSGDYASGVARALYGIIPFLGPQMEQAGEHIQQGQVARGIGESTGLGLGVSAPGAFNLARSGIGAGAGAVGEMLPEGLRGSVATALTTPEGKLSPFVNMASKVAGTGLGYLGGHLVGEPIAGALIGREMAPEIVQSMIGERPAETELGGQPMSYEEKAAALQARGRQQAALDRQAAREAAANAPQPELGSPENPGWQVPLPSRMPKAAPVATGAPGVPAATTPGVNVIPEPRPTFQGEQPNYMASVPRGTLLKAANAAKPGAGTQLQQLGKTVIYAPSGAGIEAPDISALQERMSPAAQQQFGPQFTAEQYGDGSTRQVTLHQGGQQQGYVLYDINPQGVASVNSSLIGDPALQGKGLGVQMYDRAIQDAKAAGAKSFTSGSSPEPGAVRVWEKLGQRYPVEKVGNGYRIDLTQEPVLSK